MSSKLIFAVIATTLGTSFQHGFNLGIVNNAQNMFVYWMSDLMYETYEERSTPFYDRLLWSSTVASFPIGGFLGSLLIAIIADKIGRKTGLLLTNGTVFIGLPLICFSTLSESFEMFIVGRFVIGIGVGLGSGLCPMYLIEIAHEDYRGIVAGMYQMMITISIFFAYIFTLPQVLGTVELFPIIFAIAAFPSLFQILTLPFCRESYRYIYITQEDEDEGEDALSWFRDTWDIDEELEDLREESNALKDLEPINCVSLLADQPLRSPLLISTIIMIGQQWSGMSMIVYFSTDILTEAGFNPNAAVFNTLGLGGLSVVITLMGLILSEITGRKFLLIASFGAMGFISVILLISLNLAENPDYRSSLKWVVIVFIYFYVVAFSIGVGGIPWYLPPELSNHTARGLTTCVAVMSSWLANFIFSQSYYPLKAVVGHYILIFYLVVDFVLVVWVILTLPETMDKTAIDILEVFYD